MASRVRVGGKHVGWAHASAAKAALWLLSLIALVLAAPRVARADSPAEKAADDGWVNIEEVTNLAVPDTDPRLADELMGLPIVRVEVDVRGSRWATKPTLTRVKFGEQLSYEAARRAMRELADAGGFSNLAVEAEAAGSGVVLRVVATPSRTVAAVQINGGVLERAGTLAAAGLSQGSEVSEKELAAIPVKLGELYRKHGFPSATISVQAAPLDDPLDVLVVIDIEPRQPRLVSQRIFVIDPALDAHVGDLKFGYEVKADDRLDQSALDEADRKLAQALREASFVQAKVSHKVKNVGAFSFLYVYVESGPKLTPLFEGNWSFDKSELGEALAIDKGQAGSLEELVQRLRKHYEAHGFLDATVSASHRTSPDAGLDYVVFEIVEGRRVAVERRVFVCLPKEVDADDVGGEMDAVLEEELPSRALISVPPPKTIDELVSTKARTGGRAAPLELTPARTYSAEAYAKAQKRVREVLLSRGYLNATIGPITVLRARCRADSPPGGCIEEPIPKLTAACKTTDFGLPIPEPVPPREVTCEPDAVHQITCSPRITLRIPMQLGPVTKVWGTSFKGNHHATDQALADVARFELGVPLSNEALEEAKKRLSEYYEDRGYAYVGVSSEVLLSPDKTRAEVRFEIEERDLVFIDDIDVEGAARTDVALIKRRVAFQKGDVYSREKLRLSEERLATLGTFSSISVALAEPEVAAKRKHILVRVSEYPAQYIDPKIGFSTGEGLRFGLEYGHRNIGSLGISLTLRIQLSYLFDFMILDSDVAKNLVPLSASQRLERRNSVRVNFPEIGLGPLVSFGIEGIDVRDNQRDFGLSREAFVPSLTYRPFRELVATLSASLELNDEQIFSGDSVLAAIKQNPQLRELLRFPDGITLAIAQRIGVSWDRRDNPFAATSGTLLTGDVEHVNALPIEASTAEPLVSHFLKMSGRFGGYVRLTQSGVAVAVSIGAGANVQLVSGSRTYPDRLFYLGGFDSVRSFLADSIVPEDVAQEILHPSSSVPEGKQLTIDDVAIRGGDLEWNPRVELRVPISGTFALGLFVDAGNLWVDPKNFNPLALRFGLGGGLRITTPIGPLAFDYGFNPDRRTELNEDLGALHFSVGLF